MVRSMPRPSEGFFPCKRTIVAHRGGAQEAPENTLAAFRKAVCSGYAIECDVRLSKDGHPVVFHDDTLERRTNGQGHVADMNLEELQSFDAGDGERMPTLLEVLELIAGRVPLIIEVKCKLWGSRARRMARALLDDINTMNAQASVIVASFNPLILHYVRRMMPEVLRGLVFSSHSLLAAKLMLGRPDILMPDYHLVDKNFVHRMHADGYRVLPWTVDDVKISHRLLEQGVDGIITNRPTLLSSS